MTSPQDRPGATMRFWISNTCKELRESADVRLEFVAAIAGLSAGQIWRFEAHENWPRYFDHVINAYAEALGTNDPRDIWKLALDRWYRYGAIPKEEAAEPTRRFADVLKDQAKRDRAGAPAAPAETPSASRTRKATGG